MKWLRCLIVVLAVVVVVTVLYILIPNMLIVSTKDDYSPGYMCMMNTHDISSYLIEYATENEGKFPSYGINQQTNQPIWLEEITKYVREKHPDSYDSFVRGIKCPVDHTSSITSYEFVLSGCSLDSIKKEDWAHTIIISEKPFPGSHYNIMLLDRLEFSTEYK